jgi:penicillin-binding protein 1C
MDASRFTAIIRRQQRRKRSGSGRLVLRLALGLLAVILLCNFGIVFSAVGSVAGIYSYFAQGLPDPSKIEIAQEAFETTKIYDRTGQHLLYEVFDPRPNRGDRTYVPLDQMAPLFRQATVAIEDRSFYENIGVNLEGLARAMWNNLMGRQIQGASSITQQLVKNVLIPQEERTQQSYTRKIKEAILAIEIARRYPGKAGKDQILEWYLNYNYYGNFAYGAEAAAQVYFGKSIHDVDLAEAAMLAAIPQYPALNPIDNPELAKKRQRIVLTQMADAGYITAEEADQAFAEELKIRPTLETRFDAGEAPHFSLYVRKKLEEEFGPDLVYGGGLRVYTTLDVDLQHKIEEIARTHVAQMQKDNKSPDTKVTNAAAVVIRQRTGEILAMMGSLDYNNKDIDGQVNIALAERQPGSSFKVFTYATLFGQGYSPATMIMDVRTAFPDPPNTVAYVPENYDRKYHGPVRIRQALACSYNIPAVWALSKAGVKNVINTAHRLGINTLTGEYYGLSLTLGGGEVRLLDQTYAYGVFGNNGTMAGQPVPPEQRRPGFRELDPVAILRVEDRRGNVLKAYEKPETKEVISPQIAYLITNILSDDRARAPAFGYNSALQLSDRPAAVKTGTTDRYKDAWCLGYTPQYVVGVWVGNADNTPMERLPGSLGAAPIWKETMEYLLKGQPIEPFVRPAGLEEKEVCAVSGLLPTDKCPNRVKELFIKGTAPTQQCNIHQSFKINKETGKLATVFTPPELVEEKVYAIYPPEAADWVRANDIPQPPRVYDDQYGPGPATGNVAISQPAPSSYISKGVVVTGNAKGDNFRLWRLEFGKGINPSEWTQIGGDHGNQVDNGPLDYWDVNGLEGMYTLQLRVVKNDGGVEDAAIQVTVDNTPPTVKLVYPEDNAIYEMEDKEWVSIQANATDNAFMDKVEFYLDDTPIGTSSVAPYTFRWTIAMSDTKRFAAEPMVITHTEPITDPASGAIIGEKVITDTQLLIDRLPGGGVRYTQWFAGGRGIISDTVGYTETHQIHVVAYDGAGNKTESKKVRIWVKHEKKKEQGKTSAILPMMDMVMPERRDLTPPAPPLRT